MRDQICTPVGLGHTWTLPEDVLRFSAVVGHDEHGAVVPPWGLPRSVGPAGLICARPRTWSASAAPTSRPASSSLTLR
ncbi:hypothetical protein [Streptomyces durhamensis]|uniref:hypothetical protein n=1 Tax=Streptomyces durhamensis TaxID=68194 RepID=UPI000AC1C43E|nr:hypothetical protein [Streptomyces durhamensis]